MPEKVNLSSDFDSDAKKDIRNRCTDSFYSDSNMAHLRRGMAALNAREGKEHEVLADEDNTAVSE